MRIYFRQEMKYHYDKSKPLDDFPAYLIAMGEHEGFTFYVKNVNGRFPTAYVEIPEGHPLYGKTLHTDALDVHGGVTYAEGSLRPLESTGWFIGWDYGHAGRTASPGREPALASNCTRRNLCGVLALQPC